ncbi:LPP20 family lipoprotein [Shewanella sp. 1_MG-2023]|uniref:LPP20 family lipoprotein n=1 Tax=unclassified Shewanella TaxID=196818 RepID=UPI000C815546|nr:MULTISPECIES: LPP20 family lipoprotein [unclassified Shewanella]MDO6612457.1 LPP20 family lipoprotein [Shewanella sp. 7_MG-2023]MDO6772502.1 LPP20 family lipoprotein [Shewanella sp. 2_MG-2023]MDO6794500.1 LPP20 family lipoprotein [Shewanella sp. 1_MG-2023]PMG74983.1 flagellar biosynthesis protein FlgP [Shewanella sp. 10N.286.51.B7]
MKKLLMAMMSVAALSLVGCSSNDKYVQWETEAPEQFPKLTAIGYAPLATQPAKEQSHKVLMAMQASKIAAYRELAEQVYGQQVDAHSQMSEWLLNSETVSTQVSGMIKGAKVIKSYPAGDMYVTELELDFAQVWNLYQQDNRPRKIKEVTYF